MTLTLEFSSVSISDQGEYTCNATYSTYNDIHTTTLNIYGMNRITVSIVPMSCRIFDVIMIGIRSRYWVSLEMTTIMSPICQVYPVQPRWQ